MGERAYRRRYKASFDRRKFEVIVDDILHRFTELAIGLERVYFIDHDIPVHLRFMQFCDRNIQWRKRVIML